MASSVWQRPVAFSSGALQPASLRACLQHYHYKDDYYHYKDDDYHYKDGDYHYKDHESAGGVLDFIRRSDAAPCESRFTWAPLGGRLCGGSVVAAGSLCRLSLQVLCLPLARVLSCAPHARL